MSEDMIKNNEEINDDDITIIELEGERYELIDMVVYNDRKYIAVTPFTEDETDDEDSGDFTILEMTDDPDDEESCILKTVDDEELYSEIGEVFLEKFAEEDE